MSAVTQAMTEWASAIRGDWSEVDGRAVKATIEDWVRALDGIEPYASWTIARHRADTDLCPYGGGHWTDHCLMFECGSSEATQEADQIEREGQA